MSAALVVLVVAVLLVVLLPGGDGSPADRRAAVTAAERLTRQVQARPTPSSASLCAAVGRRTRQDLAGLARFLPVPRTTCAALPNRLLRVALAPLPGTDGRRLAARIDGGVATVRVQDGPEVTRATQIGARWIADPGTGGVGAWRLETARRCSRALTSSRLAPLEPETAGYRHAVTVRLRGVADVLEMLQPDRLPAALSGLVGQARTGLTELRDGLRSAVDATGSGDDQALARSAPDSSQLPSVLQLLEAFAALRELGAPCLGGPSSPSAVQQGNAICTQLRQSVDIGYRRVGRSDADAGVAEGFHELASSWRQISDRVSTIDLSAAAPLTAVRADAVRAGERVALLADRLALRASTGGESTQVAADLDLAQQSALDGLMALGFRDCGTIS